MKKNYLFLIFLMLFTLVFTSCDMFLLDETTEQECIVHQWSDYKYNESHHWREYTCGCDWQENKELHFDHDDDHLCDICEYGLPYTRIVWVCNELGHAMIYEGVNGALAPDIVFNEGAHNDENNDNVCDVCAYKMK